MGKATVYCIMHTERCVAQVSTAGECKIYFVDFMSYGLVLKESNDFDTRINNVISFHSWCASRLIPRDRTYAKEILNSIGASQSVTDRKRAQIESTAATVNALLIRKKVDYIVSLINDLNAEERKELLKSLS